MMLNLNMVKPKQHVKIQPKKQAKSLHMTQAVKIRDIWDMWHYQGIIDNEPVDFTRDVHINNMIAGKPCVVVGSGFPGRGIDWEAVKNIYSIGINHMIETFAEFDFLIFQDHRFLRLNKFDLSKFNGHIVTANSNPYWKQDKRSTVIKFVPRGLKEGISKDITEGLYARASTGLCALNLAIVLGANPIYIVGMDMPTDCLDNADKTGQHYSDKYPGIDDPKKAMQGYIKSYNLFKNFREYTDRIIDVCPNGFMKWFKQISMEELNSKMKEKTWKK